jgi:hypothetical protein
MPDRIVRTGILASDSINALSWAEEVFYRRLMSVVDDYGRFDGRDAVLLASLYPLKLRHVSETDIGKWKRACATAGLVSLYSVEQREYIEIAKFNQRIRGNPKFPPPPSTDSTSPQTAATCGTPEPTTSTSTSPSTSKGGVGENYNLPPELNSPEFRETWAKWVQHRKEKHQKLTPTAVEQQWKRLVEMGLERATAAILHSIAQGWTGIYEDKQKGTANGNGNKQHRGVSFDADKSLTL